MTCFLKLTDSFLFYHSASVRNGDNSNCMESKCVSQLWYRLTLKVGFCHIVTKIKYPEFNNFLCVCVFVCACVRVFVWGVHVWVYVCVRERESARACACMHM